MKIAIIGGHLSPALAFLQQISPKDEIIFIGKKYTFEGDKSLSLEYTTMQQERIRFFSLTTGRLQRRFTRHTFSSASKFPYGYLQALSILMRYRPSVVVGFGGYLSVPVCLAARSLRIPVVIHEQTTKAGMANKLISRFAEKICLSWDSSFKYFPKKRSILTGNLIRNEIINMFDTVYKSQKKHIGKKVIYVTGGSSGSHAINLIIENSLEELLKKYIVIHQTGNNQQFKDFERLTEIKSKFSKDLAKNYELYEFIKPEKIADVYIRSDLIIGRCGGNTMTELLLLNKPCLLIPLENGQHGEQLENAIYLKNVGLAQILLQDEATKDVFVSLIEKIMENLASFKIKNVNLDLHLNASKKMYEIVKSVYEKKASQKSKN